MLYPVYPTNSNLHEASFSPLWFSIVVVYHICKLGLKVYFRNWVFEFVIIIPSEVIFSASGNHSNNTRDTKDKFGPGFTLSTELHIYAAGIRGHFHEYSDGFEHPKSPFLYQATHINTCQIFLPKKSRNRKFQTSKNPSIIRFTWNPEYPHWKA